MFKSVLLMGHLHGIRIELHISWLIIFVLFLFGMTTGLLQQFPDWPLGVAVATALLTVLVFFASILAHELGHSLVAIRRGIPVHAITLFIFGGVAQMGGDSQRPNDEFWIAIAGPLVSLGLAAGFGLLGLVTAGLYEPLTVALGWLALINLVVAVFNLIPGFPLDGGRVFRALIWKITGDARKGMRAAVAGGRLVAYALFMLALLNILLLGNVIGGLWMTLIAWFLLNMAEGQGRAFDMQHRLSGVRARDLANPDIPRVAPDRTLHDWIQSQVLPTGRRACLVGDGDTPLGLISLSDARRIPQEQWSQVRVDEVMTGLDRLVQVDADTGAHAVLQLMSQQDLNQVPVTDGGRVIGWIDRQQLLRSIELHMEIR
ncbi:MAG: site-2 protease family protein [Ectothiorhodospiraceae bacterium]|nr:site-2 protease family protein [Ectothiorhodospiraceae bacterium]